jgi:transposase
MLGAAIMKMREVVLRAVARKITWNQAADVLGISYSAMERLRQLYGRRGYDGFWVRATGGPRQRQVALETVEKVLLLYQRRYSHISLRSFHEKLKEKHGIDLSYEWVAQAVREAGLIADPLPGQSRAYRQS